MSNTYKTNRARKAHSSPINFVDYYNDIELRGHINSKEFREQDDLMRTGGCRHGNKRRYEARMKVLERKSDRQKLKREQFMLES